MSTPRLLGGGEATDEGRQGKFTNKSSSLAHRDLTIGISDRRAHWTREDLLLRFLSHNVTAFGALQQQSVLNTAKQ